MPVPKGVRFRVTTTKSGKQVRLAIRGGSARSKTGTVVEAKNLATGATHTPEEFAADRRRRENRGAASRSLAALARLGRR